ncbi:MAG: hypothetical protein ABIR71_13870 [Chthoniobacterales bacterium]
MSDVGVLPPGALVWLASLAWSGLCLLAIVMFFVLAWRRTRSGASKFSRDRFVGYALGAWFSGIVAGLTMSAINWSGSLGAFARWVDGPAASAFVLGSIVAAGPVATLAWNGLRRRRQNANA